MKYLLLLLALGVSLATSAAQAQQAGDHVAITPAQAVDVKKGQIEILEFFWYRCGHCFNLEPDLKTWSKKLPRNVILKRVPAILNSDWAAMARVYYALDAIGMVDKLHGKVFDAIHVQGMDLSAPETFFDWAVTQGIDRKKIANAYHSFNVETRVTRAQQLTRNYQITGVPAIAVNGKYLTSAGLTGGHRELFQTVDALIAEELKRR
jgi:protein dithiol oxidoreductase (disulfide-forming)